MSQERPEHFSVRCAIPGCAANAVYFGYCLDHTERPFERPRRADVEPATDLQAVLDRVGDSLARHAGPVLDRQLAAAPVEDDDAEQRADAAERAVNGGARFGETAPVDEPLSEARIGELVDAVTAVYAALDRCSAPVIASPHNDPAMRARHRDGIARRGRALATLAALVDAYRADPDETAYGEPAINDEPPPDVGPHAGAVIREWD
jgi:hypothetical protein